MGVAEAGLGSRRLRGAIGIKLAAEVFGRLAQFGTLALVARSLPLADFGYYGLALVVGFLLAQLADFGLHLSVTRQLSRQASNPTPTTDFAARAFATKLWLTLILIMAASGWVAFDNLIINPQTATSLSHVLAFIGLVV